MSKTFFTTPTRELQAGQPLQQYFPGVPHGNIFYVHNSGEDSASRGRTPGTPLATLDYAVGLCQANNGDVIYLLPGHNEGLGNAQIDIDVAGVSVIGLGGGGAYGPGVRPRIDFDHANASIDIGANGVTLKNITLLPSVTDVLIGIDVEAGKTDVLLEDIEALPGEDGGGVDDFALVVDAKAGADRLKVRRLKVRQHASAAGYIAGVRLTGASNDVEISNCDIAIIGAGVVAPINGITTLSTNLRIFNNILQSDAEPGIELLTGTTGIVYNNFIATDLATKAAAIAADAVYMFENYYCEVVTETGGIIGTASADD